MKAPKKGEMFEDLRDPTGDYVTHVVSVIKDNGRTLLVLKGWVKRKSRWAYEVMTLESFQFWEDAKIMKKKTKETQNAN